MNAPMRIFAAKPATRGEEPLSIGLIGPPGGGKTYSALRLATGIKRVRGGDIILIDTERGRSRKYSEQFKFHHVEFNPPFKPEYFWEAIKQQLPLKPAAIIVDSMSDEHEGEGGYLDWHDDMVPKSGGNKWAAWRDPSNSRRILKTRFVQVLTPLIFCFRAREKTSQTQDKKIVNLGWMPVAPLEIVHALDMTCILPPKADGVPVWKTEKLGEDFIIKLPEYLKPYITEGQPLSEEMGAAFARWALGHSGATTPETMGPGPVAENEAPGAGPGPAMSELADHDIALGQAAEQGLEALKSAYKSMPDELRKHPFIKAAVERRHKPTAQAADAGRVG